MKDEKITIFIREAMQVAPNFRRSFMNPPECIGLKLSPHQMFCLMIIYKSGPLSMSELAIKLGVSNQQLTRIVDSLVNNNLVERYNDLINRRVVNAQISNNGKKLLFIFETAMHKEITKTLEVLTEEEIDICIMHLRALGNILSKVFQ